MKFRKACKCQGASASGPRFVITSSIPEAPEQTIEVKVTLLLMACDTCNTPWIQVVQ